MGRLENKAALVTGSSRGMGSTHVKRFVAEGAKVIAADINAGPGEALAKELGPNCHFEQMDDTKGDDWKKVIAKIGKEF